MVSSRRLLETHERYGEKKIFRLFEEEKYTPPEHSEFEKQRSRIFYEVKKRKNRNPGINIPSSNF
jgi:hypothetical protein